MAAKQKSDFDSKAFFAMVGNGHAIGKYKKGAVVFAQGDAPIRFFISRKAR